MMTFWTICVALLAIALAFILPPLWRRVLPADAGSASEANLSVYRDHLAGMESDLRDGAVTNVQFEQDRQELERRLLEDVSPESPAGKATKPARASAKLRYALAFGLPLAAVLLYLKLGDSNGLSASSAGESIADRSGSISPGHIQKEVAALAARLAQTPGDYRGWILLARTYTSLERYKDAADAFENAATLVSIDADLLADYAFASSMANGGGLQGKPADLIQRALELDPGNSKALALAGNMEYEAGDYRQAVIYWERLLRATPSGSELAQPLSRRISEARELADSAVRK